MLDRVQSFASPRVPSQPYNGSGPNIHFPLRMASLAGRPFSVQEEFEQTRTDPSRILAATGDINTIHPIQRTKTTFFCITNCNPILG